MRLAINGFGRIGRALLRAAYERGSLGNFVHINDLASSSMMAHLFRYDTVHGRFQGHVNDGEGEGWLIDGEHSMGISHFSHPSQTPWDDLGVDIVFECTGLFTDRASCQSHMDRGAKKVIVSAPAKGADQTIVFGVNHGVLTGEHHIISSASCTTNALAPLVQILHETWGVRSGFMTTIHSYTNDQNLLDLNHKDPRRARAAGMNMIPTSTGAASSLGLIIPSLEGKIQGIAIRVPVVNVSLVDLQLQMKQNLSPQEINQVLSEKASGDFKGILSYTDDPLVSSDFQGQPYSSIVDGNMTKTMDETVKILSWYDNEMGFCHRMLDLAFYLEKL